MVSEPAEVPMLSNKIEVRIQSDLLGEVQSANGETDHTYEQPRCSPPGG